ncbi:hypothetical protein ACFL6C_11395 [Myxococcota bacterium]
MSLRSLTRSSPWYPTAVLLLLVWGCGDGFVNAELASETYRSVSNELLRAYEPNDFHEFRGAEIADKMVFYRPRMIGNATVEGDYKAHLLDNATHDLLETKREWRDDLPLELPAVISAEEAMAMVDGPMRAKLYFVAPDSSVFPISPTPENPCWAVTAQTDEGDTTLTVIDAVDGVILGQGNPPPTPRAFAFSGPKVVSSGACSGAWTKWYENAANWYSTMGYGTNSGKSPSDNSVRYNIGRTSMYYHLAHGWHAGFTASCNPTPHYIRASDIKSWIAPYPKIPFSFIGSCGGMCYVGASTLSYELRKGSSTKTATVGYCGMDEPKCDTCWLLSRYWQDTFFKRMSQGNTVRSAFDLANSAISACGVNNCMRFAGDPSLKVVQRNGSVLNRDGSYYSEPEPLDRP